MARLKLNIALVLLISSMISYQSASSFNPAAADKVLQYFRDLDPTTRMVDFWWKIFLGVADDDVKNSEILDEVKQLSHQLSQMGFQLGQKIEVATSEIPKRVRIDSDVGMHINSLVDEMIHVDYYHDEILKKLMALPNDTSVKNEYVQRVLKTGTGPLFHVHAIYRILYPSRTARIAGGLLHSVNEQMKLINSERCDEDSSPQQWLFSIYINVMITEVRSYILNVLAYSIEAQMLNETRESNINFITEEFTNRIVDHVQVLRRELSTSPRYIRRCDPPNYIRGQNFIEFERLMQPYVVNEDLFPQIHDKRCTWCTGLPTVGNRDLKHTKHNEKDEAYRPCNGTISHCMAWGTEFFHQGLQMCLLPEHSVKRYSWVKSRFFEKSFGDPSKCDGKKISQFDHQHTIWSAPFLGGEQHDSCKYCLCVCSNEFGLGTLRSVSIRDQVANYLDNMVVTGVRLVQKNRLIHIQIRQGKLIPAGKIEPGSNSWVSLEEMSIPENAMIEVTGDKRTYRRLNRGQDYVFINELNNNLVLEDVMAKKGEVIVGVAFTAVERRKARDFKALALRIMTAPFNWTTGEVGEGKWQRESTVLNNLIEAWKQSDNIHYMPNLDDPLKPRLNLPNIQNTIIQFYMSDMEKDVGQSVVPFFDALPVEPKYGFPLGGIGLIHKTAPGYGGFITPRIHNVDLIDYMFLNNFVVN